MKRFLLALVALTVVACSTEEVETVTRNEPPPTELREDDERILIDSQTAMRELELEIERLEEEWAPEKSAAVAELHTDDIQAARARIKKVVGRLVAMKENEGIDFNAASEKIERRMSEYERRLDVLEAAMAHAMLEEPDEPSAL